MANMPVDDGHHDTAPNSTARQKKESRRPDIAIYRPGQLRLGKRAEDDPTKSGPTKKDSTSTKNTLASTDAPKKEQTQQAQATPHGDREQRSKQTEHKRHVRDRDEGGSSARGNERRSAPRDQRSNRDNRKNPDHRSERSSGSNRANRSVKTRAEQDRNLGHELLKDSTSGESKPASKPQFDRNSAGNKPKEEARDSQPESKSVGNEQQSQVQREKRWHGPQGKRKVVNLDAKPSLTVGDADSGSNLTAETTSAPSRHVELDGESLQAGQTKTSGRQEQHLPKASLKSPNDEKVPSNSRRGNNRQNNHESRTDPRSSKPHRSHHATEGKESNARSSETGSNHNAKQKKPERSFYMSPKLVSSESQNEEAKSCASDRQLSGSGRHSDRVASDDSVETMIFTSRKTSNKNWPQKANTGDPRSVIPKDSQFEKFTLENNKKVPLKSLLDLQLSPPSPKPSRTDTVSPKETMSQNAETKSKAAHQSKRYSAKRLRQRYNSESSTGSDNSQFVDVPVAKSVDWDQELASADSKLQSLGLEKDLGGSRDSVSSADSGKRSGMAASQKNKTLNQNLKKQLHSRKDVEDTKRGSDLREQRKQLTDRGKLSVTFNSQVREVKISPEEESQTPPEEESENGRYEDRSHSWVDKRNRQSERESRRSSSESDQVQADQTSKGGGLIRLPQKRSDPVPIQSQQANQAQQQQADHTYRPIYDRYYAPPSQSKEEARPKDPRGRHANWSLLWDPSKPQEKPALASAKKPDPTTPDMHFYDAEYDGSPKDYGFDPRGQFSPQGYGYYPPQHMMQMPAGTHPPPSVYPTMSWAEQVEAHNTDPQGQARSPPSQIPNYQGNFPPLGIPPELPPAQSTEGAGHSDGTGHPESAAMAAVRILQDTVRYEHSLNNAVSRRFHGDESVQKIMKLSQNLEQMYAQVILTDLETCNKHNVEQLLWKSAYYQLIEALRRQEAEEAGTYKTHLEHLLSHGCDFYVGLLEKLQSAYHFHLENHTGLDPLQEEPRRTIKLALLSAQRCMISLGDIARYKELTNDTNNYGKARSWYLKAQHLAPRNGRPYNQLAILALYTRRKLDAVYYYMRSLAASNPFLTARESLMSLFEEVRRKVEHKERAQVQAKQEKEKSKEAERRRQARERGGRRGRQGGMDDAQSTRKEIWIASDGSSHDGSELPEDEEEDEEEALKSLSPVEINKKFVLSLLNVHGKLFTKIGMEYFDFIIDRLLKEFSILLTHSPTPVTSTRLIQAMAINMFAAHNTETKDQSPREDMRSLLQEQSIQLGLDMFGLLVNRCNQLLTEHLESDTRGRVLLSEDLLELLPGVKVYADWLMCHPHLWNPPPCCTHKPYSAAVDIWACLAELLNTLKRIDVTVVQFVKKTDENNCQEILLPEDVQLSGFVPLLSLPLQPVYVPKDTHKMEAMDCVRIISLLLFGEYACGQETPLLAYDVSKNCYISVAPEIVTLQPVTRAPDQDDDDVIIEEDYSDNENASDDAKDSGGIGGLRQKKEDLERRLHEQQQKQAQIQATMESHRQQRNLEVEIRPLYLVPDTNCFIDHLTKIQALLACRKYKLVVPLVVINELDGLAKGSRDDQYEDADQGRKVQEGAEMSIKCLEAKFEQRNKYLRALTSKGTVMDTIAYRSEELNFKVCNDDLILKCCLHYVDDRARDFMPSNVDSPIRLYRDVVLLTNDRNLRVKALQQNVPVKDIIAFTKWAKV